MEPQINTDKHRLNEITFKNQVVGTYAPDFIVENQVIVELKTIDKIGGFEKGQVLNYLRASGLKIKRTLNALT